MLAFPSLLLRTETHARDPLLLAVHRQHALGVQRSHSLVEHARADQAEVLQQESAGVRRQNVEGGRRIDGARVAVTNTRSSSAAATS